ASSLQFGYSTDNPGSGIGASVPPPGATLSLVFPQIQAITLRTLVAKNIFFNGPHLDSIPDAPDWLLPKWSRYLKEGILGKMMLSPKKTYTNFDLGKMHWQ